MTFHAYGTACYASGCIYLMCVTRIERIFTQQIVFWNSSVYQKAQKEPKKNSDKIASTHYSC